jgi:hypothetical protein
VKRFPAVAGIPIGTAERLAIYPSLAMVVVLGVYLLWKSVSSARGAGEEGARR